MRTEQSVQKTGSPATGLGGELLKSRKCESGVVSDFGHLSHPVAVRFCFVPFAMLAADHGVGQLDQSGCAAVDVAAAGAQSDGDEPEASHLSSCLME